MAEMRLAFKFKTMPPVIRKAFITWAKLKNLDPIVLNTMVMDLRGFYGLDDISIGIIDAWITALSQSSSEMLSFLADEAWKTLDERSISFLNGSRSVSDDEALGIRFFNTVTSHPNLTLATQNDLRSFLMQLIQQLKFELKLFKGHRGLGGIFSGTHIDYYNAVMANLRSLGPDLALEYTNGTLNYLAGAMLVSFRPYAPAYLYASSDFAGLGTMTHYTEVRSPKYVHLPLALLAQNTTINKTDFASGELPLSTLGLAEVTSLRAQVNAALRTNDQPRLNRLQAQARELEEIMKKVTKRLQAEHDNPNPPLETGVRGWARPLPICYDPVSTADLEIAIQSLEGARRELGNLIRLLNGK